MLHRVYAVRLLILCVYVNSNEKIHLKFFQKDSTAVDGKVMKKMFCFDPDLRLFLDKENGTINHTRSRSIAFSRVRWLFSSFTAKYAISYIVFSLVKCPVSYSPLIIFASLFFSASFFFLVKCGTRRYSDLLPCVFNFIYIIYTYLRCGNVYYTRSLVMSMKFMS